MTTDAPPLAADTEAEGELLAAVLFFPERIDDACDAGLTPEHFFRRLHAATFSKILELREDGAPIDLATVCRALSASGQLDVGAAGYLARLGSGVVGSLDVVAYARQITLDYARRQVITHFDAMKARVLEDRQALVNGLPAAHVATFTGIVDSLSLQRDDVLLNVDAQLAAHADYLDHEAAETIKTGFSGVDDLTGGTRAGEVFGVMARPGTGKTLLLANIADNILQASQGMWVLFFSLEMPAAQIIERQLRICLGVSSYQLRQQRAAGRLDLHAYVERFGQLLLVDRPSLSLAQIGGLIGRVQRESATDHNLVVLIDHFGLLGGDRGTSVYERVSTQARELKNLAKRYNVPVLVAIQVSREAGGDGSKELGLGAARDSGVIEEAMDYLVALRQPSRATDLSPREAEATRDLVMMKLVKNRHGALGNELAVKLDPLTLRMWETTV